MESLGSKAVIRSQRLPPRTPRIGLTTMVGSSLRKQSGSVRTRQDARLRLPRQCQPVRRRVDAAHVDRGARGRRGGLRPHDFTLRSVFGPLAPVSDLWAAVRTAAPGRLEAAFAYGE